MSLANEFVCECVIARVLSLAYVVQYVPLYSSPAPLRCMVLLLSKAIFGNGQVQASQAAVMLSVQFL
jgi:hypothetical protein